MNAKEAREIAERNLKGPVIDHYLNAIHAKIAKLALAGKFSLTSPLSGISEKWPDERTQQAIWLALQNQDYKVVHHPDPDPGHPGSHAFTEISWE